MIGTRKAFTLVEIVVAVAVFAVIVLAAVRVFQSSLQAQRDINWDYTLQSDSQYFLGVMARELSGALKSSAGECDVAAGYTFATDGATLNFKNSSSQCVIYASEANGGVDRIKVDRDGSSSYLSGLGVDVNALAFSVADSGATTSQPLVTINLRFTSLNSTTTTAINTQLSVSPLLSP
jgi:prepilin-type N-terminal cleavage/methylation domain-containing protein